jgi:hypothetical protein
MIVIHTPHIKLDTSADMVVFWHAAIAWAVEYNIDIAIGQGKCYFKDEASAILFRLRFGI